MKLLINIPILLLLLLFRESAAQTATTDPAEVMALNSVFESWGSSAVNGLWNMSGEPCSGSAINGTEFESPENNPGIACDCTFNNGSTCHITKLRVYALQKKGVIPQALAALSYLTFLKIDQNYFTGPLPAFIGNLTQLTLLSIAINAFSGPIPKELGNLRELTVLSFGSNNFSGSLPPELGNLINLQQFYISSAGVSGVIPSTFVNLSSLQTVWASDIQLQGKIPNFIGTWTNLIVLRLEGNDFEGPIPTTFANLTSLTSLRITDLYNMSSSLDFIKDMRNLNDLVLRNVLISENIPSVFPSTNLQSLDLSFNNLTGQVPRSLFNSSSLISLFLGNNRLLGTLPPQKSSQLQTIDLSYNELSGSFPSWVNANLQLNLVANNFTFDSSNTSLLPGLNCLQRNFPCNRNSPRYSNFAVKCGGDEMRPANSIVYEADNTTLGSAKYFVTTTQKWGASNVGLYAANSNPTYITNNLAQAVGTSTPELFQTQRQSPGSLRYYGLGLQNGPYTVTLLFAETIFDNRGLQTWQSLGRRIFNIYSQGSLIFKDFDISKEAGGVERAVQKNFNVTVAENYLEIHLYWAGKGTCCIPVQGYYGPSISALSVTPDFEPTVSNLPPTLASSKKEKTSLIVGLSVSIGILSFVFILAGFYIRMKKLRARDEEVLLGIGPKPNTFSYAELRAATKDFSPDNKLGEGGFGPVYKGILTDGRLVGIKQLSVASHQGKNQFVTEIATISAVQHRNLVKLYGCCIEGDRRLLVYEYLENKSLDQALFGESSLYLDWPTRFGICLGTARGLAYLHEESRPRIVHRDVKASNILLDTELRPKLSDFGLAKLYDDKKTHISTRVAGTIGYLAPEYAMRGHLTEKADVFGFGVAALEILCGRPNSDNSLESEKIYLLDWVWSMHENNQTVELVDPRLTDYDGLEVERVIGVSLLCTQASPMMRPSMSRVVGMLSGDVEVSVVKTKPSYLTDWDFKDITTTFLDDTTMTFTSSGRSHEADQPETPLGVT